jgi:hypothetical protein
MVRELFKKIYINTLNPLDRTEGVEYYTTLACLCKQGLLDEGSLTAKERKNIKKVMFMVERVNTIEDSKFKTYPGDIRLFGIGDFPEIHILENAIVIAGPQEYVYAKKIKGLLYFLEYSMLTKEELIYLIKERGDLFYVYTGKMIKISKIKGQLPPLIIQKIKEEVKKIINKIFERELINI